MYAYLPAGERPSYAGKMRLVEAYARLVETGRVWHRENAKSEGARAKQEVLDEVMGELERVSTVKGEALRELREGYVREVAGRKLSEVAVSMVENNGGRVQIDELDEGVARGVGAAFLGLKGGLQLLPIRLCRSHRMVAVGDRKAGFPLAVQVVGDLLGDVLGKVVALDVAAALHEVEIVENFQIPVHEGVHNSILLVAVEEDGVGKFEGRAAADRNAGGQAGGDDLLRRADG